jgi:uncharacterized HAD superfamily protein
MAETVIGVDLDDVIALHAEGFVNHSNETWGTRLTVDDYGDDWQSLWQVDEDTLEVRKRHFFEHAVPKLLPVPEAQDGLERLAKHGDLVIVTARRESIRPITETWLDQHFPGVFRDMMFSGYFDHLGRKHNRTKLELCQEVGASWLIDDMPQHCRAVAEGGIQALLFGNHRWNREEIDLSVGVTRAINWLRVNEIIDEAFPS